MTISLWLDEAAPHRPALQTNTTAPVAILGGGMSGISTAYWLAQRGIRSVVLEAHRVGFGATGRNAGFVLEGTVPDYPELISRYGREGARSLWDFTVENRRRWLEVCEREPIACDVASCGSVVATASRDEMNRFESHAALLTEDGYRCDLVDGRWLQDHMSRSGDFIGGLYTPQDVGVNPVRFVRGLAAAAERRGVEVYEQTPVRAVERDGAAWTVETATGDVRADRVVLGLNAYTALVDPAWQTLIRTARGQVLATAPVAQILFRHLVYANDGFEYWRQLTDGRVVLGGLRRLAIEEEVGIEDRLHARIQDGLDAYLRHLGVPASTPVTHRWSGIMGFTPDRLPLIGPVVGRDGMYVAGGYSGHGLAFAFLAGRMIAELTATGATDYPRALFPSRVLTPPPSPSWSSGVPEKETRTPSSND
jgi:glycine/D-amino acid oxidase-like deaminating enzyme